MYSNDANYSTIFYVLLAALGENCPGPAAISTTTETTPNDDLLLVYIITPTCAVVAIVTFIICVCYLRSYCHHKHQRGKLQLHD